MKVSNEKIRTSREKNELPTSSPLAKQSPSSRDGMDVKVASTVDITPYADDSVHTHRITHIIHTHSVFSFSYTYSYELRQV